MEPVTIVTMAVVIAVSIVASLLVLWIAGKLMAPGPTHSIDPETGPASANTILLRCGLITDHDCARPDLFEGVEDWADLRNWLGNRFEGLPQHLPDTERLWKTFATTDPSADPATIKIEADAAITRVILTDPLVDQPADKQQELYLQSVLREDQFILRNAPFAIWKTDEGGKVFWQNDACKNTLGKQLDHILENCEPPDSQGEKTLSRVAIPQPHSKLQTWFDVHSFATGRCSIFYAIDITTGINAEAAQREFVQTLTKTFANLTTGLAIFDINQQLALFNPALIDLTALPAEFLSARPSLMSFFDNLRDRQVMPEPKNYSNWRAQINEMIQSAADGLYQETWSLPSGVTYRVTGRPHPDGAVAFLFEDITAEISLTRRFRAQNDLRQSVIDKLDHAVAVIASNNVVIFCNETWTDMFGVDPDTSFAELGIRDLVAICREKYPHPDFWENVETQTTGRTVSQPLEEIIQSETDGLLHCRLVPVTGGSALICFPVTSLAKNGALQAITS